MENYGQFVNQVVDSTRDYVFVRDEDGVLIIKPNKVHYLNRTGVELLGKMYSLPQGQSYLAVKDVANNYGVKEEDVARDARRLLETILELLKNPECMPVQVKTTSFGSHKRELPVLSEIALTYRCQNKCVFCYASSPERGKALPGMTTDQVKKVLLAIKNDAKVPTVSLTGGEPTLRKDIVEIVSYAKSIGLRVNLITNGIICGVTDLPYRLKEAGLDSAQVSIESSIPEVHDRVVGHPMAFKKTVDGFKKLKSLGIHTHINTTICKDNISYIDQLPKFAKEELGLEYQSMNMVIRTGHAQDHPDEVGYTEIARVLPKIKSECKKAGIKLVWYSPMPYCIINTVAEGIGGTSCAASDGLLSVAPDGSILPCSSFENGVGNLLKEDFRDIWFNRQSLYFRKKEFVPPVCNDCDKKNICCGACPLYWDNRGCFDELGRGRKIIPELIWKAKRKYVGKSRPVGGVADEA